MVTYKINMRIRYSAIKIFFAILLFFSFNPLLKAGDSFGFLTRIYSPRISALAGAYTPYYGDINGIFANPAGLAYIENNQLCINYARHLLDFNGGMIAFTHPMSRWGNLSLGLISFDYGNFEQIDKYGIYTGGNFSARDLAVAFSYANCFTDQFAYAITAKYIFSKIGQYSAAATAIDIGFLYRSSFINGNTIGLALLNWGYNFDPYQEIKENLPLTLAVGISQKFSELPLTFHLSFNHALKENNGSIDKSLPFSMGTEISLLKNLNMRLGYDLQKGKDLSLSSRDDLAGFSFGFGWNFGNNSLDYSYNNYGALGQVHYFGFTFNFAKSIRKILLKGSAVPETISLNPPEEIKATLTPDHIIITWQHEKGMAYNLYVRNGNKSEWIKINDKPFLKGVAKLKKSYFEGKYDFAVTTIKQYAESELSQPVSLNPKNLTLDTTKSLNPPEDVRKTLTSKNIVIYWNYVKDATYNLYIRYAHRPEWIKMNDKPFSENMVKLKKVKLKDNYDLAVTTVKQNSESGLSQPISIYIE